MKRNDTFWRVVPVFSILWLFPASRGTGTEDSPTYLLKLSSIGFPTAEKQKEARRTNDLKLFAGRLYLGHGDADVNTGPTDVVYYDLKNRKFITEFTVDDEGIYSYRVIDGKLVIPGVDATEGWELGNIYVLSDSGWLKHRTVPHGIHVIDAASFGGKWWVSTGNYFEFGKDELFAIGGILSSEDEGRSWKLAYSTPCDDKSVFRVRSLVAYKGRLYAFPYAHTDVKTEGVPEEYRPYLGNPYRDDLYIIFIHDAIGAADAIAYDGSRWHYVDLIEKPDVCFVSPFVFKDKLIMSVLSGKYVSYVAVKEGLPGNATSALYAFDGIEAKILPLQYDLVRDVVVKEEVLLLLLLKGNRHYIAETSDLKSWKHYLLPQSLEKPKSIEYDGESFYVGMKDGNIFKSTGVEKLADLSEAEGRQPTKIFGAAELPRDGLWYWAAITQWRDWGKLAEFSCEIERGNQVNITTSNISEIQVFLPSRELDLSRPITLSIDGQESFKGRVDGDMQLMCKSTQDKEWRIERGRGTAEAFHYARKIVGRAEVDLPRTGDGPLIGSWKADVLRWAAPADLAVIATGESRRTFSKGEIALEDVFDLNYRNTICRFKAKGETIRRLMEFNVKLPEGRRCQISGFSLAYEGHQETEKNRITQCSLDPEREYLVATSDYLARRTKGFFGEEVDYEDTNLQVNRAMLQWFEEHEQIGGLETRITVVSME